MDETAYQNKMDTPAEETKAEEIRREHVFGDPARPEYVEPEHKKDGEADEILPGDVHSALGSHDPSNGGAQIEGDVKTVVNKDPKKDQNYPDRPAGWPVISEKPAEQ